MSYYTSCNIIFCQDITCVITIFYLASVIIIISYYTARIISRSCYVCKVATVIQICGLDFSGNTTRM